MDKSLDDVTAATVSDGPSTTPTEFACDDTAPTEATAAEATAATVATVDGDATAITVGEEDLREPKLQKPWQVGTEVLGRYRVIRCLGSGAFGSVFLVEHELWQRELAVKRPLVEALKATGGSGRVVKEAEAWIDLGLHPHLASCYFVQMDEGTPLIFSEYVAGGSLAQALAKDGLGKGKVRIERALDIAIQLFWALGYSHENGLLHQDVKPANILLGQGFQVKLTDFGCARSVGSHAGALTPAYASPEQMAKEVVTEVSDCWSAGLVLLECLLGERSWTIGSAAKEVLEANSSPREVLPDEVKKLLVQIFSKERAKRPKAAEVASRLTKTYEELLGKGYSRKAVKASPKSAESLNNRALSLLELGRDDEALNLFDEALKAEVNHPTVVYNRFLLAWRKGFCTDEELISSVQKALSPLEGEVLQEAKERLASVHLERDDAVAAKSSLGPSVNWQDRQGAQKLSKLINEREKTGYRLGWTKKEHKGGAQCVIITPDGKDIVSGGRDGTLIWYTPERGTRKGTSHGHNAGVQALVLSPSENWRNDSYQPTAFSGGADGRVIIWDVRSRTKLGDLKIKSDTGVTALATFGLSLVVGGSNVLSLYKVMPESGRWSITKERDFDYEAFGDLSSFGKDFIVTSLAFCSNRFERGIGASGDFYLVVGCDDAIVRVFRTKTGECVRKLTGHSHYDLMVASNDFLLASGSRDNEIRAWDPKSGDCISTLKGHRDSVHCVHFCGPDLVSGGKDATLRFWDVHEERCLYTSEDHCGNVWSLDSCNHPVRVVSASGDGSIRLRFVGHSKEYKAPYELCRFETSETMVAAEATYKESVEQCRLAIYERDFDGALRAAQVARKQKGFKKGKEIMELWLQLYRHHCKKQLEEISEAGRVQAGEMVFDLSFGAAGRYVLAACFERGGGVAKMWDRRTKELVSRFEIPNGSAIHTVTFTPDGLSLIYAGNMGRAFRHSLFTKRVEVTYGNAQESNIRVCRVSGDGRKVFLGRAGNPGVIDIYQANNGTKITSLALHGRDISGLGPSYDGKKLLSASQDGDAILWDVDRSMVLFRENVKSSIRSVTMDRLAHWGYLGCENGIIVSVDCHKNTLYQRRHIHKDFVHGLVTSSDGHRLFSVGSDRQLHFSTAPQCNRLRTVQCHDNYATALAISNDGSFVATGSHDGTVALWSLDWQLYSTDKISLDGETKNFIDCANTTEEMEDRLRHCGIYWFTAAALEKHWAEREKAIKAEQERKRRQEEEKRRLAEQQKKALALKRKMERRDQLEIAKSVFEEGSDKGKVLRSLSYLFGQDGNQLTEETGPLWRELTKYSHPNYLRKIGQPEPFASNDGEQGRGICRLLPLDDGDSIVAGHEDGHFSLWSLSKLVYKRDFDGHSGPCTSLVRRWRGQEFFSASLDGRVLQWTSPEMEPVIVFENACPITTMDVNNAELSAALGQENGRILFVDLEQGHLLTELPVSKEKITTLSFSFDGQLLYVGTADGTIKAIETSSRSTLWVRTYDCPIVDVFPTLTTLSVVTEKNTYSFNDYKLGNPTRRQCLSAFTCAARSNGSNEFVALANDVAFSLNRITCGNTTNSRTVAISRDDNWLIAANDVGLFKLSLTYDRYIDEKPETRLNDLVQAWLSRLLPLRKVKAQSTIDNRLKVLPKNYFSERTMAELFAELPSFGLASIPFKTFEKAFIDCLKMSSFENPSAFCQLVASTRGAMNIGREHSLSSLINKDARALKLAKNNFSAKAHTALLDFKAQFFPPLERASINTLWPMYICPPTAESSCVTDMVIAPSGDVTYLAHNDGTVTCHTNDPIVTLRSIELSEPIVTLSLASKGLLLAALGGSKCYIIDCEANSLLSSFPVEKAGTIALSANGSQLVVATTDGALSYYKTESGALDDTFFCQTNCRWAFSRNGQFALGGSENGELFLIDCSTKKLVKKVQTKTIGIEKVAVDEKGELALLSTADEILLWSLKKATCVDRHNLKGMKTLCFCFNQNSRAGLIVTDSKSILTFRSDEFTIAGPKIDELLDLPAWIQILPNDSRAIGVGSDGTIYSFALEWRNNYPKPAEPPKTDAKKNVAKQSSLKKGARKNTRNKQVAKAGREKDPLELTDDDFTIMTFGCGGLVMGILVFLGMVDYLEMGFWSSAFCGFIVFVAMAAQIPEKPEQDKIEDQSKEK